MLGGRALNVSHNELKNLLNYEGEIAVIKGLRASEVSGADAARYSFGYMIVNVISSLYDRNPHRKAFFSEGLHGSCPIERCIVTATEVGSRPLSLDSSLIVSLDGLRLQLI
jgi:2-keto-4-pentenoate hydratase/2-oxohepta-3-ene-1,7-dioic acid hydratase in catechol pathway